jgi:hypothetical protein
MLSEKYKHGSPQLGLRLGQREVWDTPPAPIMMSATGSDCIHKDSVMTGGCDEKQRCCLRKLLWC